MSKRRREWVYVLALAEGRFYVGCSRNPVLRLEQHTQPGCGSEWTRRYTPVGVVDCVPKTHPTQEDSTVKRLMFDHGISMVRGGSYVQMVLPGDQLQLLRREITHARGGCFACGNPGHFIKSCPLAQPDVLLCFACGVPGHFARSCPNRIVKSPYFPD